MARKPTADFPSVTPEPESPVLPVVDRGPCPVCRSLGAIRCETVLKGGHTARIYSCAVCECSWHFSPA